MCLPYIYKNCLRTQYTGMEWCRRARVPMGIASTFLVFRNAHAMVSFKWCQCNRKDNNDAFKSVSGCVQQFLIPFQFMTVYLYHHRGDINRTRTHTRTHARTCAHTHTHALVCARTHSWYVNKVSSPSETRKVY